jgi:hypothetical protein
MTIGACRVARFMLGLLASLPAVVLEIVGPCSLGRAERSCSFWLS